MFIYCSCCFTQFVIHIHAKVKVSDYMFENIQYLEIPPVQESMSQQPDCQGPLMCACKGLNWGASEWWCKRVDLTDSGFFSFMSPIAGILFLFLFVCIHRFRKTEWRYRKAYENPGTHNNLLSTMPYLLWYLPDWSNSTCFCWHCAALASAYRLEVTIGAWCITWPKSAQDNEESWFWTKGLFI